jgi:hypothetical protein
LIAVFVVVSVLNQVIQQPQTVNMLLDDAQIFELIKPQISSEVTSNISLDSPYANLLTNQLEAALQPPLIKTMFTPVVSGLVNWLHEPFEVEPRLSISLTPLRDSLINQPPAGLTAGKLSDYQFFVKKTVPDDIEINPRTGSSDIMSGLTSLKTVVIRLPQMQLMMLIIIGVSIILTAIASLLAKKNVFIGFGLSSLLAALILFVATLVSPQIMSIIGKPGNAWLVSLRVALAATKLYGGYIVALAVIGAIATGIGLLIWLLRRNKQKHAARKLASQ